MPQKDLSRRTFLATAGAVAAAGTLIGCGGGGFVPGGLASDGGADLPLGDGLTSVAAQLEEARRSDPALWNLTRGDFEAWREESFDVATETGAHTPLELVDVLDRSDEMTPDSRALGLREPFSVCFHAPLQAETLPSGRHSLSHPAMGEVLVYIAESGTTEDAAVPYEGPEMRVYELHFN